MVHFPSVEKEVERADHLRMLVTQRALPSNFSVIVEGGTTFEEAFGEALFRIREKWSLNSNLRIH